ncbi:hypothetical protein FisN_13Hu087 [Fistulifera solaris]|uniref:MYND-type domain-containing protein n=1 Tax=Fistulifera solaris TaxID=1519565 RepID=A0A1Z5KNE0_FISSO|nr:hypothetical protein FisN_13Hu087 [Fistulifera solaris]|eukprot:GAX27806.1 hypothetical protein FisN_13Hu087 [Fistulifera solaris]
MHHGLYIKNFLRSLRATFAELPSYEGKDTHVQDTPWCAACHSRPVKGLLCCARCRTAWYCNRSCQKAHYKEHQDICLCLSKDQEHVEKLAIPLRSLRRDDDDSDDEPENVFEMQVGAFGQQEVTLPYMNSLRSLVTSFVVAAHEADIKQVWETTLAHALELQRLDAIGPQDIRCMTPFMLLNLNRDDDAFDFMRHWMKIDDHNFDVQTTLMIRYAAVQKGQWIYPRKTNSRFLDIFQECPDANDQNVPLGFLLALLAIKCRLLATYDVTCKSIDLAFATTGGKLIQEVQSEVTKMLFNETLMNIESQREQVERLVIMIHRNNPIMLPALLNPEPLVAKQYTWQGNSDGASEVFFLIFHCARCLIRVPGVRAMLEKRFGKCPSYEL